MSLKHRKNPWNISFLTLEWGLVESQNFDDTLKNIIL